MLKTPFKEPYKVDASFGEKRSYGYHSGSDINGVGGGNTDCGYKLYPIKNAEIVHTSEANISYGKVIVYKITGSWGERWIRYCHCNELLISNGLVSPDTPIATLGTTGNSTACHLHVDCIKRPLTNWRMYAKDKSTLDEYFEDYLTFFNKYKDVPDENSMELPNWFKTLLQENNLSLDREGEFRSWWEKSKKYDSDTNSLKEQVKSANEALADRALEVSQLTEKNQKLSDAKTEAEEQLNKVKSERDQATWQNTQDKLKIEKLDGEIVNLQEKIDQLEKTKGYKVLITIGSYVIAKKSMKKLREVKDNGQRND